MKPVTIETVRERLSYLEGLNERGVGTAVSQQQFETACLRELLTLLDDLVAAEKRIAELERSETQLIDERDNAESALNDAYKAVMGQAPEWSNWFSFENAIDEIELVCELWRNQTDDVIQFRQRIAELEAREVTLPAEKFCPSEYAGSQYWEETEVWNKAISACAVAVRAAGIKVKES